MQQWNLSLERQRGGNWLALTAYMGNKATHLRTVDDQNVAAYVPGIGKSTVNNTAQRRLLYLINPTTGSYYSSISTMNDGLTTVPCVRRYSECVRSANPAVRFEVPILIESPQRPRAAGRYGFRFPSLAGEPMACT
jgi:hypothetical protein